MIWRRRNITAPHFGVSSKKGLAPDAQLWKRNQKTGTLELLQKTRKKIKGLCVLSFFPRNMLFLFVHLT